MKETALDEWRRSYPDFDAFDAADAMAHLEATIRGLMDDLDRLSSSCRTRDRNQIARAITKLGEHVGSAGAELEDIADVLAALAALAGAVQHMAFLRELEENAK